MQNSFISSISVSQFNGLIEQLIKRGVPLQWVYGEISGLKTANSGHVYFTLKDELAQVPCVMYRNKAQLLPIALRDGLSIEVHVLATLYKEQGKFQLQVENLKLTGAGALYEQFLRCKAKLQEDGLLDPARKRPLPLYPHKVVLITSSVGAALQDILSILKRRASHLSLVVCPVNVQGSKAVEEITAAIHYAPKIADADVVLLARGGGSAEDLHVFNNEALARAIASCPIPVLTGIGHETDITLADLVSDVRASTPSSAAELVSQGYLCAQTDLQQWQQNLSNHMQNFLAASTKKFTNLVWQLGHMSESLREQEQKIALMKHRLTLALQALTQQYHHQLELKKERLRVPILIPLYNAIQLYQEKAAAAHQRYLETQRATLHSLHKQLENLNPLAILARGYSVVHDQSGRLIDGSEKLAVSQTIAITFSRGSAEAEITKTLLEANKKPTKE